jgi:primary-amine oxidase
MLRRRFWLFCLALLVCLSLGVWGLSQRAVAKGVTQHPLDPLTAEEIQTAVRVLKTEKQLSEQMIFIDLALQEPDKQTVLKFQESQPFPRQAAVILRDLANHQTYEAVVDLQAKRVNTWQTVTQGQPPFADSDYETLTEVVKANPQWQAALQKRGISDFAPAVIDGWALGLQSEAEAKSGKRLMRGITYYPSAGRKNYYGAPIENLMVTVDLDRRQLVDIQDYGVVPFSKANFDYDPDSVKPLQAALKPLLWQQPQGASFQHQGRQIQWHNWTFRYLLHPREGLTLYQVAYQNRPVLYRASLSEMVVPYADPTPPWVVRSAFDVGEYRFGWLSTTLVKGKDVPNHALLLDALFTDEQGQPSVSKDVLGIYERDGGILWRHYDFNTEDYQGHRARELVLATVAAIGNYDYGINWIFHQDGTLTVETDLTGIMLAQATAQTQDEGHHRTPFGTLVAPNVVAVNHQHFMNFRLDFDVDGPLNNVAEMNVKALPVSDTNPQGNAFSMQNQALRRETEAVRDVSLAQSRSWVITSAQGQNSLGAHTGYMLMPGGNAPFYPAPTSNVFQRGQFASHHFWVTAYHPQERYAAGDYPNQGLPNQGLPQWIADNQSLENQDLVVWYTMGVTHIPRPEEWPIMTVHPVSFKIMPWGFFSQNPVLNVADPLETPK